MGMDTFIEVVFPKPVEITGMATTIHALQNTIYFFTDSGIYQFIYEDDFEFDTMVMTLISEIMIDQTRVIDTIFDLGGSYFVLEDGRIIGYTLTPIYYYVDEQIIVDYYADESFSLLELTDSYYDMTFIGWINQYGEIMTEADFVASEEIYNLTAYFAYPLNVHMDIDGQIETRMIYIERWGYINLNICLNMYQRMNITFIKMLIILNV